MTTYQERLDALDTYEAVARDEIGPDGMEGMSEWLSMGYGTRRDMRTLMVAEAGFMAKSGWQVVRITGSAIVMQNPEKPERTVFRVRRTDS